MKLNALFQDGAVLQRNMPIPVWGQTDPCCMVKVVLNGVEAYGRSADFTGEFLVRVPAMKAGGPYELVVENVETGDKVIVQDVLVGEVWVASGQSNMHYLFRKDWLVPSRKGVVSMSMRQATEFKACCTDGATIRYFSVPLKASGTCENSINAKWKRLTAETADGCSAVAAWFGRFIQKEIRVPVGLIVTAWGGTIAEAWTSRSGLLSNPDTANLLPVYDSLVTNPETWQDDKVKESTDFKKVTKLDTGNTGFSQGWADYDCNSDNWINMNVPGSWIAQKIAKNGAVWFRCAVDVPESWAGKDIVIQMGPIDKHDITYFNGVEVGRTGKDFETEFWKEAREYKIPGNLVRSGKNIIAVRVYSFYFDGGFFGDNEDYYLKLDGTDEIIELPHVWKAKVEYEIEVLQDTGEKIMLGPGCPNTPGILFDSMIRPLLPYGIRGVIWYQGESNASNPEDALTYRRKIDTMIKDWRYHWEQGNFPFIQVQLANWHAVSAYNEAEPWPYLRECQRCACNDLENVYMIPAIDIGDEVDIHPQDKKSVGRRLADNALCNVYHNLNYVPCGPMYRTFSIENNEVRLFFDHADGLALKDNAAESFYVANGLGVFMPADAIRIEGNTVVVSSSQVAHPTGVRYAWADNPKTTLVNGVGLPASSFSTFTDKK